MILPGEAEDLTKFADKCPNQKLGGPSIKALDIANCSTIDIANHFPARRFDGWNKFVPAIDGQLMSDRTYNVLFLSSGNSARSTMAEAILRKDGASRFNAFSAGIHPKGEADPLAIKVLTTSGFPVGNVQPKSWLEFAQADAPVMDFIFIVTDSAAGEKSPSWPGQPITATWGIEQPGLANGNEFEREKIYFKVLQYLKRRISLFIELPLETIDRMALGTKLQEIGLTEGPVPKGARTD